MGCFQFAQAEISHGFKQDVSVKATGWVAFNVGGKTHFILADSVSQ